MRVERLAAPLCLLILLGSSALATVAQEAPTTGPFSDYEWREEIAERGSLEGAQRVLRFVQISDAHIIDDDAPYPLRQDVLDDVFGAEIPGYGMAFTGSAARPQEEYTDEILNSIVARINGMHAEDPFSFVMNTGDNIDNQLENELMRFIDNWEGTHTTRGPISGILCLPDGQSADWSDSSRDVANQCTSLPSPVAIANVGLARGLPWYSAFGNHDGLIQGNVPIEPGFNFMAGDYGRRFIDQEEYVAMHFEGAAKCNRGQARGGPQDDFGHGYGFAKERLCDGDPDNDGYYSFDQGGIHFIVLDTINDDFLGANSFAFAPENFAGYDVFGGYAQGAIDPEQFAWLQGELAAQAGNLTMIFSHHTINSFVFDAPDEACAPQGCLEDILSAAGYVTRDDMERFLGDYPNVVAWIGGHTHKHRVQPKSVEGANSTGFWSVETSSLVDMPQEGRVIEVWVTADGSKGFLALKPFSHDYELARQLALSDTQKEAAEPNGTALDQEVVLWFDIASGGAAAGGSGASAASGEAEVRGAPGVGLLAALCMLGVAALVGRRVR